MTAFGIVKFLHVVSVAFWLGGIALLAFFLRDAMMTKQIDQMNHVLERAQHWNLVMFVPTSVIVLLTGVIMMMTVDGHKPSWLLAKERFGSLFVILFILFVVFNGRKTLAKVKFKGFGDEKTVRILKYYIAFLIISLICMVILIFFVTVK
ncbi:DUF2269 family protein [Thermoactinomyces mirandus]|uniref:DUF2269 family protein n=1 Tax=Thermoactinomyces mirandus TaxID=2756294 RepID=A0A7W2AT45_9BACL|nr:DUF2269 family protein [Thermoactinomyces mirandus]MBA4603350.1 DUF2269 family protein [Thermoactinomyces mirandus]